MEDLEKNGIKHRLNMVISDFIVEETSGDNNIGWIPDNMDRMMTDAAFSVMEAVTATNEFMERENLLAH